MPRNRSEKLPRCASGWSKEGIDLARMFGQGLSEKLGPEWAETISQGSFGGVVLPEAESIFRARGPARDDYNRDRSRTYTLITHFFKEAHAEKP